jgi:phospholipid-translocating ATPase
MLILVNLQGDKMETAINIGFASNLLQRDMLTIIIKAAPSSRAVQGQIKDALAIFWDSNGVPLRSESHALIIDGESLNFALDDECRDYLLELSCRCKSVICCRVSPLQKAQVVALVRKGLVCCFLFNCFRVQCVCRLVMGQTTSL